MAQGSERGTLWLVGFVLAAVAGATVGVFSCGGGGGGNSGLTAASAVSACVHICQCEVGNDPICTTSCESTANCVSSSGSFGSCSSSASSLSLSSFSFSFW